MLRRRVAPPARVGMQPAAHRWLLLMSLHLPVFLVQLLCAGTAAAADLEKVRGEDLRRLISFSEVVAQRSIGDMYRVRFFLDREYGDCGRPGPSCPRARLYVAIILGELPGDDVYLLARAYEWRFVKWNSFPEASTFGELPVEAVLVKTVARDGLFSKRLVSVRIDNGTEISVKDAGPAD